MRWRVDVAISSNHLSRIMRPTVTSLGIARMPICFTAAPRAAARWLLACVCAFSIAAVLQLSNGVATPHSQNGKAGITRRQVTVQLTLSDGSVRHVEMSVAKVQVRSSGCTLSSQRMKRRPNPICVSEIVTAFGHHFVVRAA